jgi:serine phosphatase RsbU (regulator of sigma subunit)
MKIFSVRIFLFFLIYFIEIAFPQLVAQTPAIDSLKQKLTISKPDTDKVNILTDLTQRLTDASENVQLLQYAKEAFTLSTKLGYKKGIAYALINIANVYRQQSNHPEAQKNITAALKIGEEIRNKKIIAAAYYLSGRTLTNMGDYDKALMHLRLYSNLCEELGDKKGLGDAYNAIGNILESTGNYTEALKNYLVALKIRQTLSDKKRISFSYNNLGLVQWDLGNYAEALKNYLQALKIQEELGDKIRASEVYNNIGNLYSDMRDYPNALKNHLTSLKLKKEMADESGVAMAYNNIGNVYFGMHDFSKALQNHMAAMEFQKKTGNKRAYALACQNLGQDFLNVGNYTEALKKFMECRNIYFEIQDLHGLAQGGTGIGATYFQLHKFQAAKAYIDTTLHILKQINSKAELELAYLQYAVIDSAMNNFQQAYLHQKLYALYHDSLFNEANTKKVVSAEMNFEFEKKQAVAQAEQEKIAAVTAAESKKQKVIIIGVSILLLLILAFALFAYRNYRLKKRSNIRLEIQKKNIDDSIRYAQRIQQAILPIELFHANEVRDHFLYYQPKDIVSGDFYWRHRIGNELFFAAIDCTGHGVPGAMMSMLGYDLLEYALKDKELREPADILNLMNRQIIQKLNSGNDKTATDGMDMTLCRLNLNTKELTYAGAKNDLYRYSKNELELLPVTKYSIGYEAEHVFTQSAVQLQSGDMLWLFTDGYCDQKGGSEGKKFMRTRWKELLQKIATMAGTKQREQLITEFNGWKGMHSQRDDILVMGVRV